MALMLRYLGIPARVGAGFTSGSYDADNRRWKVTDHDAHTWVEVWFRGYGWLPFDPTPGRGDLDGAYSAASVGFNAAAVSAAIAAGLDAADYKLDTERFDRGGAVGRAADGRDVPGDIAGTTSGRDEGSLLRLLLARGARARGRDRAPEARAAQGAVPDARPAQGRRRLSPRARRVPRRPEDRGSRERDARRARRGRAAAGRARRRAVRRRDDGCALRAAGSRRRSRSPRAPRAPAHRARAATPTLGLGARARPGLGSVARPRR